MSDVIRRSPDRSDSPIWVVYGTVAIATGRSLVIETIAIGPASKDN